MKMAKKPFSFGLLLILTAAVVLTSGCVGGGGGGSVSGSGVVITSFEPSLSAVESDDNIILHLEIQNQGDAMGNAVATLLGIYTQDWQVFQTDQILGDLLPSNPDVGTEGQRATANWQLKAPSLTRGERRTYEPIVRVFYSYETKVTKPITFVTSEELRRVVQTGESLQSDPTISTAGPISVDVKTGNFIRTRDDWQQSWFPVEIDIDNTGGGLIAGQNYPVGIEITAPQGTMFRGECPRRSQVEWGAMYDTSLPSGLTRPVSPNTVFLWDGKSTKITCELQVVTPPDYLQKRDLKVTLKYIYYTDQKTSISVTGTKEWGI